jgi:hypothetical protein
VVLRQWKPPVPGARCEVALVLLANHVAVLNERKCAVDLLPEEIAQFQVRRAAAPGVLAHSAQLPFGAQCHVFAASTATCDVSTWLKKAQSRNCFTSTCKL